jgi:hypothetical protein
MKNVLLCCFALLLFASATGVAGAGGNTPRKVDSLHQQLSAEALVVEAEAKYAEYLGAQGGDRRAATEQTAAFVQSRPGVQEVTVRGSDSLMVRFTDGNELLLMLGSGRL